MSKVFWPSWRYSPTGEAKIFNCEEEVPVGWMESPQPKKSESEGDESAPKPEEFGGFSRLELEQILRKGGERIYAKDSARKMFARAEAAGLIVNGQLAGDANDDAE